MSLVIRPAQRDDREGIIALIDGVYREYGDEIHLSGADADLLDIDAAYRHHQGEFVVLADDAGLYGTHATIPLAERPGVCTFRRLYLDSALRGQGHGDALMEWAISWARDHKISRVEFWSDTRFTHAHRFFARHGFTPDGRTRDMDDGTTPYREYFFFRDLQR